MKIYTQTNTTARLYDLVVHALKKGTPINDADKNGMLHVWCLAYFSHLTLQDGLLFTALQGNSIFLLLTEYFICTLNSFSFW